MQRKTESGHTFAKQSYSRSVVWLVGDWTFRRKIDAKKFEEYLAVGGISGEREFLQYLADNDFKHFCSLPNNFMY